ncbi:hypothetical protein C4572_04070, partial [Candidatus Parcubacteria bacterium]
MLFPTVHSVSAFASEKESPAERLTFNRHAFYSKLSRSVSSVYANASDSVTSVGSFLKGFIFPDAKVGTGPADRGTNPADNGDAPKKQNTADSSNSNNIYSYDKKELE